MPISGVLVNVHDAALVLAMTNDGKVEGQSFNHTDNQRWIAQFKYDGPTKTYLWSVQNRGTGNYLSWNSSMQVLMSDTQHWWKLAFVGENFGFQVPNAKDDHSHYTLELEDDASVTLKQQTGELISRQLWNTLNE